MIYDANFLAPVRKPRRSPSIPSRRTMQRTVLQTALRDLEAWALRHDRRCQIPAGHAGTCLPKEARNG